MSSVDYNPVSIKEAYNERKTPDISCHTESGRFSIVRFPVLTINMWSFGLLLSQRTLSVPFYFSNPPFQVEDFRFEGGNFAHSETRKKVRYRQTVSLN